VAIGQLVDPVVDREIDVKTLTPNRALRGPSGRMDGSRARRERLRRGTARGVGARCCRCGPVGLFARASCPNENPRRSGSAGTTAWSATPSSSSPTATRRSR
jgi:hypothetical protein